MNEKILVVDDDKEILNLVGIYLSNEGYEVYKALSGYEALNIVKKDKLHLVVLDIMMPDMDGMEVCRQIRREANIPIIMLSAKGQNTDKVAGLLTGADDYITKPFDQLEFIVRVKTLLRRAYLFDRVNKAPKDEDLIQLGLLTIRKSTHLVFVEDVKINLTAKEFDILVLLASSPGRVFSAEEIFEHVWKERYFQSNNTVMVHVCNLRDKLQDKLKGESIIHTVWGVGYKIEKDRDL
ncbi:response regulator transcription factor [Clostridium sp. 19966]|uniref:response regulator transcription factor n=1 Tax=Clostridium sp. 19966 TaxID=2768166 RepID=UPI0028DE5A5E|nr:response regulator transcription factor [Clostridium sp. 19966]MDT8716801.1 response regulator transcription factor [Clostridium sp. 19966]